MKMNPEEITAIIKDQIKNYNVELNVDDVGTVIEIGDGIAHIHGLEKALFVSLLIAGTKKLLEGNWIHIDDFYLPNGYRHLTFLNCHAQ